MFDKRMNFTFRERYKNRFYNNFTCQHLRSDCLLPTNAADINTTDFFLIKKLLASLSGSPWHKVVTICCCCFA